MAEAYVALLAAEGVRRGLIGPRELPRIWERHILNCGVLQSAFPASADVADLGSGAGLPGVVVAIARPDLALTLVEPMLRRATFLAEVVERLRLGNVTIVRERAEDLHGRRDFDAVTARALAPLERLLDWSMPLVRQGGLLVAMKGASAREEVDAAGRALHRHGVTTVGVHTFGVDLAHPTTALCVVAARPSALQCAERGVSRDQRPSDPGRRKGRRQ